MLAVLYATCHFSQVCLKFYDFSSFSALGVKEPALVFTNTGYCIVFSGSGIVSTF